MARLFARTLARLRQCWAPHRGRHVRGDEGHHVPALVARRAVRILVDLPGHLPWPAEPPRIRPYYLAWEVECRRLQAKGMRGVPAVPFDLTPAGPAAEVAL